VEIISLQSHRDTTLEVAVPKVEFLDCYVVGYDVLWKIRVFSAHFWVTNKTGSFSSDIFYFLTSAMEWIPCPFFL